jgi:hypothetical protein
MATYNKFNIFSTDLVNAAHHFGSHTFKVMLTNTAPVATNAVLTDLTEITAGNGYTAGGTASVCTQTNSSGTLKLTSANVTFTAAGGSIGPFRYAVFYNSSQTSPAKPLISWFDYGSSVTLNSGETFTWTPDATNGLFTIA